MLGGSFWVALLRNGMSAGMMMTFFLLLDRPRFPMRKTILCYVAYFLAILGGFSTWYCLDFHQFVRFSSMLSFLLIGVFCAAMSRESAYLSIYKMALSFYLFTVCVLCGVDAARWWFDGNIWVDVAVRFVVLVLILLLFVQKIRKPFLESVDFLTQEMDSFIVVIMLLSIFIGAVIAYWPNLGAFSVFNMVRAVYILVSTGVIQYIIFHMYFHLGREHAFQREKELLEINEQLLHNQLELMRESEEEAARIRHDIRHHCLMIEEFIRNDDKDRLVDYVRQYGEEMGRWKMERFCGNDTINSILSVYTRRAREEGISVEMDAKVGQDIGVRNIDLIAIIANVFENAIHGCMLSEMSQREIGFWIRKKGGRFLIRCRNTCPPGVKFRKGRPVFAPDDAMGISSIVKTVSIYSGETDFTLDDGMLVTRIVMNLGAEE